MRCLTRYLRIFAGESPSSAGGHSMPDRLWIHCNSGSNNARNDGSKSSITTQQAVNSLNSCRCQPGSATGKTHSRDNARSGSASGDVIVVSTTESLCIAEILAKKCG